MQVKYGKIIYETNWAHPRTLETRVQVALLNFETLKGKSWFWNKTGTANFEPLFSRNSADYRFNPHPSSVPTLFVFLNAGTATLSCPNHWFSPTGSCVAGGLCGFHPSFFDIGAAQQRDQFEGNQRDKVQREPSPESRNVDVLFLIYLLYHLYPPVMRISVMIRSS